MPNSARSPGKKSSAAKPAPASTKANIDVSNAQKAAVKKKRKVAFSQKLAERRLHRKTTSLGSFGAETMSVYAFAPQERIDVIRQGIPAGQVAVLAERMHMPKEWLIDHLRISRATLNRKVREKKPLPQDESERVLGLATLIGQVETMLAESGIREGFDVAQWMAGWIKLPLPALGGRPPADYLDTVEGQKLISHLLATAQSGAYA